MEKIIQMMSFLILEDLYFQQTSFVDVDENKVNRFADIADKFAKMN